MKKINFTKYQIGMMVAVPSFIVFCPMTVEIFIDYFKLAFTGFFIAATLYIIGFILVNMFKPQKINLPSKSARTQKAGKLIATKA